MSIHIPSVSGQARFPEQNMLSEQASYERVFPDTNIIDCDAHITEPADLWTSRGPATMRDRLPTMRNVGGRDMWFVDGDIPLGTL